MVALVVSAGVVSATAKDDVRAVLTEYVRRLEAGDAEGAHALFSTFAQRTVALASVEALTVGNSRALVSGFSSLDIDAMSVVFSVSLNRARPAGLLGRVQGRTHYHGGFTGTLNAVVQREEGAWRLVSVFVTVSPDKIAASGSPAPEPPARGTTSSSETASEGSDRAGTDAE